MLLAHAPFTPPFDYQEILQVHSTAKECGIIIEKWLPEIEANYFELLKIAGKKKRIKKGQSALRAIKLGDHIAENEHFQLGDYFIETASYLEALSVDKYTLFVGRKGSGKTAIFYKVLEDLSRNRRNFISTLKPVDYDVEGLLQLLEKKIPSAEQGFLLESFWKYIIYSQIAYDLYKEIRRTPSHLDYSDTEKAFLEFIDQNRIFVSDDLTPRMENAIANLAEMYDEGNSNPSRERISEKLHSTYLSNMRELLGLVLEEKQDVRILIDNLDKAWRVHGNLKLLSEFIFSLLGVSRRIAEEFEKVGPKWKPVKFSMIVFLRSDIFSYIYPLAREPDKLSFSIIDWSDRMLLKRIIDERIASSFDGQSNVDQQWDRLFVEKVDGHKTYDYILDRILPRPRDIIYFCKVALSLAINRRHALIEKEDVEDAEVEYSEYAFQSRVAEIKPKFENIEEILVEFAGANVIITKEEIKSFISSAGGNTQDIDSIIDLLFNALFLGLELSENDFKFLVNERDKKVLLVRARKFQNNEAKQRFLINTPFQKYLGISALLPT